MDSYCCTYCCTKINKGRSRVRNRPLTWVELRGFEPLTPSMRTRCATGLRYSPWNGCQRSKHRSMLALQSPTARLAASAYWS